MTTPPFVPKEWKDLPDETTPLDAAALKDLETRVTDYTDVTAKTQNPYSLRILADNPTGYWPLGEVGPVAVDVTKHANGTYIDGATPHEVAAGLFDQPSATRLHQGDWVSVPRDPDFPATFPNGFTVEMLWRVEAFSIYDGVPNQLFNLRYGQFEVAYMPSNGHFEFSGNSFGFDFLPFTVVPGTAYHIVLTYDLVAAKIALYVNGQKMLIDGLSDVLVGNTPGPGEDASIVFGGSAYGNWGSGEHTISDSAFYNRVLSPTSVAEHYASLAAGEAPGDLSYVHNQLAPGTTWNIAHNLGKKPSITISDSAGTVVVGDIHYVDDNNATLTFTAGFGGKAYCN